MPSGFSDDFLAYDPVLGEAELDETVTKNLNISGMIFIF